MKVLSSLIASCLAFTYASNVTDPTTPQPTDMSTTMYTSSTTEAIIYNSVVYDKEDDPTDDFEDCDYSWMGTIAVVDIDICGYTVDNTAYTAIKLDLPSKRWVAFGLSADGAYDDDDVKGYSNYDGYNIIIPIQSDNIEEIFFTADGETIELELTLTIISDVITEIDSEERRIMRLIRAQTVTDVNNTMNNMTNIEDYYFSFTAISSCDTEGMDRARGSVTYGPTDNSRIGESGDRFTLANYGNRGAMEIIPEFVNDIDCGGGDGDDASHIMVFGALIMGFITILLF